MTDEISSSWLCNGQDKNPEKNPGKIVWISSRSWRQSRQDPQRSEQSFGISKNPRQFWKGPNKVKENIGSDGFYQDYNISRERIPKDHLESFIISKNPEVILKESLTILMESRKNIEADGFLWRLQHQSWKNRQDWSKIPKNPKGSTRIHKNPCVVYRSLRFMNLFLFLPIQSKIWTSSMPLILRSFTQMELNVINYPSLTKSLPSFKCFIWSIFIHFIPPPFYFFFKDNQSFH